MSAFSGNLVPPRGTSTSDAPPSRRSALKQMSSLYMCTVSPFQALGPYLTVQRKASRRPCRMILQEGPSRGEVALTTTLRFPSQHAYLRPAKHKPLINAYQPCELVLHGVRRPGWSTSCLRPLPSNRPTFPSGHLWAAGWKGQVCDSWSLSPVRKEFWNLSRPWGGGQRVLQHLGIWTWD